MSEKVNAVVEAPSEGSWIPLIVACLVVFAWWAYYSQSSRAIRFRRWYNMQVKGTRCLVCLDMLLWLHHHRLGGCSHWNMLPHELLIFIREYNWKRNLAYATRVSIETAVLATVPTNGTSVKGDPPVIGVRTAISSTWDSGWHFQLLALLGRQPIIFEHQMRKKNYLS